MADLVFADLSHWRPVSDYALATANLTGAILKATNGIGNPDDTWQTNIAGFTAAGMKYIADMHFLTGSDPIGQAHYFLDTVQPDGKRGLALDYEDNSLYGTSATPAIASSVAYEIFREAGIYPMLYTGLWWIGKSPLSTALTNCPLWATSYQQALSLSNFPPQWNGNYALWQCNNGVFGRGPLSTPGIGPCDHSIFNPALDLAAFWPTICGVFTPKPPVMVAVPYDGQWDDPHSAFRAKCGVVCVAMLLQKYGIAYPDIDSLCRETNLTTNGDAGLWPDDLIALAAKHGLTLTLHENTAYADIQTQIAVGNPLIALIDYSKILGREDKGYFGSHFVVITGISDSHVYCNDPDFWGASEAQGKNFAIPIDQFESALRYDGLGGECLFVPGLPVQPANTGGTVTPNIVTEEDHDENGTRIRSTPVYDLSLANVVGSIAYHTDLDVDINSETPTGYVKINKGIMVSPDGVQALDAAGNWILRSELIPLVTPPTPATKQATVNFAAGIYLHTQPDTLVSSRVIDPLDGSFASLNNGDPLTVLATPTNYTPPSDAVIPMYEIDPSTAKVGGFWVDGLLLNFQ